MGKISDLIWNVMHPFKVKHPWWDAVWTIQHIRDGKVIWEQARRNALVDEGERNVLLTYFRQENAPTTFYLRLAYDSLLETDGLANISNEPVGNGYSAQQLTRDATGWPTIELDAGDYRLTSKEVEFNAVGGNIGPVNVMYLATTSNNTGLLVAFVPLALERTILAGDTLRAQIRPKLK
jgi:hypothetical protein